MSLCEPCNDDMDDAAKEVVIEATLAAESAYPEQWYWLSFVAPGQGFIGGCYVRGRGIISATIEARAQGCNPGGEVLGVPVPDEVALKPSHVNRLLDAEEANDAVDA